MKRGVLLILLGVGAFVAHRILIRKVGDGSPVPLDDLTASEQAEKLGIDNGIPTDLVDRARGLAVIVGALRGAGFRVTSMYRSRLTEAAVTFHNRNPNVTPDVAQLVPEGGPHTEMRAVDVGGDSGPGASADVLKATQARLRSVPVVAQALSSTLLEGDHVHCEFDPRILIALGQAVPTT